MLCSVQVQSLCDGSSIVLLNDCLSDAVNVNGLLQSCTINYIRPFILFKRSSIVYTNRCDVSITQKNKKKKNYVEND